MQKSYWESSKGNGNPKRYNEQGVNLFHKVPSITKMLFMGGPTLKISVPLLAY